MSDVLKHVEPQPVSREAAPATHLAVSGMTCNNCARHVAEALQVVPGVSSATVDLANGRASVRWMPGQVPDEDAVLRAVEEAGYTPKLQSTVTRLRVKGMDCGNCVRQITEALQAVTGVDGVRVNLEQGEAQVIWKPNFPSDEQRLMEAVSEAGYNAEPLLPASKRDASSRWSPFAGWQFNVVVGTILTVPLLVLEWGFGVGMERWYHWLAFVLVLPIQTICGARFYRGAWNQLKIGSSNMDTLVALGSTTAFLYSAWGLFAGWQGHLFFMESASIITLISVGHWVESKVSARAEKSLRSLLNLAPPTARIIGPNEGEIIVPVSQLKIGDRVILKPGDRVPVDGDVVDGSSSADESMLTGESIPTDKGRGSKVLAGTLNLHGWLLVKVAATGADTALAHIIAIVERAQNSRANIQKLGDRVSSVFVPIVVLVAIATGLWWGLAPASAQAVSGWLEPFLWTAHHPSGPLAAAIYHAAAVLIIACPCAMGLATPVAIMAGTNVASERGILIRDGAALEKTGTLTAVIFDKTGTVTLGQLKVVGVEDFLPPDWQGIGLQKIAASLAKPSLHPVSQAVAKLSSSFLPTQDWREVRGSGVEAQVKLAEGQGGTVPLRLGSLNWLREAGGKAGRGAAFVEQWSAKGATILVLADGEGKLLGLLALMDVLKPNAAPVVEQLRVGGKAVYLITGDNKLTAAAIAQQAGIPLENVFAEVRPETKAEIVRKLQERGERVAFIGDGINDAPALEQADLGIAVSRASDVAREAADIILLKSDIQAIPEALALAQKTLRTIKQNLFWAFFYNTAGIPLAALGFLSPILSAAAMGFSDLIVIGNALRLRRWKYRPRA